MTPGLQMAKRDAGPISMSKDFWQAYGLTIIRKHVDRPC